MEDCSEASQADCDWKKQKRVEFNINRKIFVGNISYRVKSRKLSKFFSKFGPVEFCYIVQDHLQRRSRGIAFITFQDEESMKNALAASDDELFLDDRQMRVKQAELSIKTTYWEGDDEEGDTAVSAGGGGAGDVMSRVTEVQNNMEMEHSPMETGQSVTIDSLFDEVLIHIFSLLSWKERIVLERVCWRWKHVVQKTWINQKTLHFQNVFKRFGGLKDKMLNSVLLRCGQHLESLDLSASPRVLTDFAMDVIGRHCPDILELDLSAVKITNVSMKNLVSKCTKLQKVKLKKSMYITDKGIQYLLGACRDLCYLDLTDLHLLSGQCFQSVGEKFKTLVLTDCYKVGDSAIHTVASRSRHLEELHISNCRELSSNAIRNICQNCSHLKVLHCSSASIKVDSEALEGLKKLQYLEVLDLSLSLMVTDQVLKTVSEGCLKLRYLDISGCHQVTDVGISSLQQLPALQSLSISYLSHVSEDSIMKIAQVGQLHKVVVRATKFMTDEAVIAIATFCPYLEHLDLCGCFQITNRIFSGFKTSCSVDRERVIELILGGTSVDWMGDDVDWLTGLSHVKVSMHNLAMEELRPDRELILPGDIELSDEEDEYPPHPTLSDYMVGPIEAFDDWDEDYDDYLDNDDNLAAERWDMS